MKRPVLKIIIAAAVAALIGFGAGYVKGYGTGFRNGEKQPNRLTTIEVANCPCDFEVDNENNY